MLKLNAGCEVIYDGDEYRVSGVGASSYSYYLESDNTYLNEYINTKNPVNINDLTIVDYSVDDMDLENKVEYLLLENLKLKEIINKISKAFQGVNNND